MAAVLLGPMFEGVSKTFAMEHNGRAGHGNDMAADLDNIEVMITDPSNPRGVLPIMRGPNGPTMFRNKRPLWTNFLPNRTELEMVFISVDVSGDGQLSSDEILKAAVGCKIVAEEYRRRMLAQADGDPARAALFEQAPSLDDTKASDNGQHMPACTHGWAAWRFPLVRNILLGGGRVDFHEFAVDMAGPRDPSDGMYVFPYPSGLSSLCIAQQPQKCSALADEILIHGCDMCQQVSWRCPGQCSRLDSNRLQLRASLAARALALHGTSHQTAYLLATSVLLVGITIATIAYAAYRKRHPAPTRANQKGKAARRAAREKLKGARRAAPAAADPLVRPTAAPTTEPTDDETATDANPNSSADPNANQVNLAFVAAVMPVRWPHEQSEDLPNQQPDEQTHSLHRKLGAVFGALLGRARDPATTVEPQPARAAGGATADGLNPASSAGDCEETQPPSQQVDGGGSQSSTECVVCLDRQATHAVIPCGHLSLCGECADVIMAAPAGCGHCPICRGEARETARIFNTAPTAPSTTTVDKQSHTTSVAMIGLASVAFPGVLLGIQLGNVDGDASGWQMAVYYLAVVGPLFVWLTHALLIPLDNDAKGAPLVVTVAYAAQSMCFVAQVGHTLKGMRAAFSDETGFCSLFRSVAIALIMAINAYLLHARRIRPWAAFRNAAYGSVLATGSCMVYSWILSWGQKVWSPNGVPLHLQSLRMASCLLVGAASHECSRDAIARAISGSHMGSSHRQGGADRAV